MLCFCLPPPARLVASGMAYVVRYPAKGEVHNPEPNQTTILVCPPGLQSFNRLSSLNTKPCVS